MARDRVGDHETQRLGIDDDLAGELCWDWHAIEETRVVVLASHGGELVRGKELT